jgi:hypothetical protein
MGGITKDQIDFLKLAYDKHLELLKHYSSQVFQTRLSIVTISLLVWGALLGVYNPVSASGKFPVLGTVIDTKGFLAFLAAMAVGVFFLMENAYFKRFLQVVAVLHRIENQLDVQLYCRGYDRKSPWPLSLYYIIAAIGFCAYFVCESAEINSWNGQSILVALLMATIPLAFLVFAVRQVVVLAWLLPSHARYSGAKTMFAASSRSEAKILDPIKKAFGFMKHHVENVGQGVPNELSYLSNEVNNPEGRLFAAYRRLTSVKNAEAHVTPHKHTVDQMYCWIGSNEDLSGLQIEVLLDGRSTIVDSPKSVYIPAGVEHSHRYVSGDGHFVGILITEGRSYNDVTID